MSERKTASNYKNILEEGFKQDLKGKTFLGEVIDNKDPEKKGRCKIGVFEKFQDLPSDVIPWAFPAQSKIFAGGNNNGGGSFSYPKIGSVVRVEFEDGDWAAPRYISLENPSDDMLAEIEAEGYENAQVLLWDVESKLKVFYTTGGGLQIYFGESHLTITPNKDIILEHEGGGTSLVMREKSTTQTSEEQHYIDCPDVLIGTKADHPATKCDILIDLLKTMAIGIDTKLPATPGAMENMVKVAENAICSNIVKIAE